MSFQQGTECMLLGSLFSLHRQFAFLSNPGRPNDYSLSDRIPN